jgi:hypothetical protein
MPTTAESVIVGKNILNELDAEASLLLVTHRMLSRRPV